MLHGHLVLFLCLGTCLAWIAPATESLSPDKPAMSPPYNKKKLASNLQAHLKPRQFEKRDWDDVYMPESCQKIASKFKLDPSDFNVFDVTYDDCAEPWTICHHKGATFTEKDIIKNFGSMPVHVRSYVRHFIGVPKLPHGAVAFTYASGDTVFEITPGPGVLAHEISHSIDFNAFPQYKSPFSHNNEWISEYAKDSHTVNAYGRTNWLEDFAATGRVAFYDKIVPGGFNRLASNWEQISHQYKTYEKYAGHIITPGGTCQNRFKNSKRVLKHDKGTQVEGREDEFLEKGNITRILTPPKYDEIVFYNVG